MHADELTLNIEIRGSSGAGKTIVAHAIRLMLEKCGATVLLSDDPNEPDIDRGKLKDALAMVKRLCRHRVERVTARITTKLVKKRRGK